METGSPHCGRQFVLIFGLIFFFVLYVLNDDRNALPDDVNVINVVRFLYSTFEGNDQQEANSNPYLYSKSESRNNISPYSHGFIPHKSSFGPNPFLSPTPSPRSRCKYGDEATQFHPYPHEPVMSYDKRCGLTEANARANCGEPCMYDNDCNYGKCYAVHPNYCGSVPRPVWNTLHQSRVQLRCGKTAVDATEFCGQACTYDIECKNGENCWHTYPNYCGSRYQDTCSPPPGEFRCGYSELDARSYCKEKCVSDYDCGYEETGEKCYAVHANYCDKRGVNKYMGQLKSLISSRCGKTEVDAREYCGKPCTNPNECDRANGEYCWSVHENYCPQY